MNILITGGLGFIGSRFAKLCIEKGHNIKIVDKMTYAAHRLATSMWEHAWDYGVTSKKGHSIWLARKTGKEWLLPMEVKAIG